jgi:CDP-glucose 4,6-dehydratase
LKLNCDKALHLLNWRAVLGFEETVKTTADWYKAFYNNEKDMYGLTVSQIKDYIAAAGARGLIWAR